MFSAIVSLNARRCLIPITIKYRVRNAWDRRVSELQMPKPWCWKLVGTRIKLSRVKCRFTTPREERLNVLQRAYYKPTTNRANHDIEYATNASRHEKSWTSTSLVVVARGRKR